MLLMSPRWRVCGHRGSTPQRAQQLSKHARPGVCNATALRDQETYKVRWKMLKSVICCGSLYVNHAYAGSGWQAKQGGACKPSGVPAKPTMRRDASVRRPLYDIDLKLDQSVCGYKESE
jgi:hypothetical protein